jgi:hypothetical protein
MIPHLRIAALILPLAVVACSSTGQIVSSTPEAVAVQVDDKNKLAKAYERADDYCGERGKRADLQRSEAVGETVVGYYKCV